MRISWMMEKNDQTRLVIHLQMLTSNEHFYYGSLSALYEHFTSEELGVAIQTLYNQFKGDIYQNEKAVIRRGRLVQKKHRNSDNPSV